MPQLMPLYWNITVFMSVLLIFGMSALYSVEKIEVELNWKDIMSSSNYWKW